MSDKKSVKISLGTVICLFIIILLIIGIIYYYNLANKNNNKIVSEESEKKEVVQNLHKEEINSTISVVDAVNYVDNYYKLFKVKLPKVTGKTKTIEEFNANILNEVLPYTYADIACHAIMEDAMDKGSIYDYKYNINNNILVIYIYSTVPNGGTHIQATGGGLNKFSYFYDIENDKILTISEASEKLKLNINKLKLQLNEDGLEDNISSYKDLKDNSFIVKIEDEKLELQTKY